MRGVKHHVRYAGGALSSEDVVLDDERTRFCGERSTTPGTPAVPRPAAVGLETPNHWRGHGAESHAGRAPPGGQRPCS